MNKLDLTFFFQYFLHSWQVNYQNLSQKLGICLRNLERKDDPVV